jgi:hypothetical protein
MAAEAAMAVVVAVTAAAVVVAMVAEAAADAVTAASVADAKPASSYFRKAPRETEALFLLGKKPTSHRSTVDSRLVGCYITCPSTWNKAYGDKHRVLGFGIRFERKH